MLDHRPHSLDMRRIESHVTKSTVGRKHLCRWRHWPQEKVAKIVQCGEPLFCLHVRFDVRIPVIITTRLQSGLVIWKDASQCRNNDLKRSRQETNFLSIAALIAASVGHESLYLCIEHERTSAVSVGGSFTNALTAQLSSLRNHQSRMDRYSYVSARSHN